MNLSHLSKLKFLRCNRARMRLCLRSYRAANGVDNSQTLWKGCWNTGNGTAQEHSSQPRWPQSICAKCSSFVNLYPGCKSAHMPSLCIFQCPFNNIWKLELLEDDHGGKVTAFPPCLWDTQIHFKKGGRKVRSFRLLWNWGSGASMPYMSTWLFLLNTNVSPYVPFLAPQPFLQTK